MFKYSICDPLKKEPIEMGDIDQGQIISILDRFPWAAMLEKMNGVSGDQIHFSPSIEFENKTSRHGLSISIVDGEHGNEFYIFYKRPKTIVKLFGLIKRHDDNYVSDRTGQTIDDVRAAVTALIHNDLGTLDRRWG